MKTRSTRWLWMMVVFIGAVSYGVLSPVIKLAYNQGYNELQVTYAQLLFGMVMLWGVVLARPKTWTHPFRKGWIALAVIGFIGILLTALFINAALMYLPASLSIVLLFQFTWITILIEFLFYGRKPSSVQVIAVGVVLIGTVLAVGFTLDDLKALSLIGLLYGFASAVTYSIFIVYAGKYSPDMDPVLKSAVMMTPLMPLALFIVWLMYPGDPLIEGNLGGLVGWGILLGVLAHGIPVICFNIGIPKIGSSLAAMIGSAELPAAVIAAYFIVHEQVSLWQWLGIALIMISIIVSEWKQQAG